MKIFKCFTAFLKLFSSSSQGSNYNSYQIFPLKNGDLMFESYKVEEDQSAFNEGDARSTECLSGSSNHLDGSESDVVRVHTFETGFSHDCSSHDSCPSERRSTLSSLKPIIKRQEYAQERAQTMENNFMKRVQFDKLEELEEKLSDEPFNDDMILSRTPRKSTVIRVFEDFVLRRESWARIKYPASVREKVLGEDLRKFLCWSEDLDFFDSFMNALYPIENLPGPKPKSLPFTLSSFMKYLFLDCRDLLLIRTMLRACRRSPDMFVLYDKIYGKKMNNGEPFDATDIPLAFDDNDNYRFLVVRDRLLLPFLVKMHQVDQESRDMVLQLMGFPTLSFLKEFYEYNEVNYNDMTPKILEMASNLKDEDDVFDCRSRVSIYHDDDDDDDYEEDRKSVENDLKMSLTYSYVFESI